MTFRQRTLILAILAVLTAAFYVAALRFSPQLVAYVVEQTLVQKAPAGMTPDQVRLRFRAFLASRQDEKMRLKALLALSQALEKVQNMDAPQLEDLLGKK